MAVGAGRNCLIKKAGTTIAGVQVTGISVDNTPIDITDNDSAGLQTLMDLSAKRALTLTVAGLEKDGVLHAVAMSTVATSQKLTDLTFIFGNALAAVDTLTCDWFMTNYKEDNDFQQAGKFSANFTSSGAWTLS